MKVPIVMKTWAGNESYDFKYISKSISSLLASDLPQNAELLIYDDCSKDPRLKALLMQLCRNEKRARVIFNDVNRGPNWGQEELYSLVEKEYADAPYFINVDDDVIYHKDWVKELVGAHDHFLNLGIAGIFTAINMPFRHAHSIIRSQNKKYLLKWKQPALNWLIPRKLYHDVGSFKDEGIAYDTAYTHWMRLKLYPIICLTPSYVQNIGLMGAYAQGSLTTARDFLGESNGHSHFKKVVNILKYDISRMPSRLLELSSTTSKLIAPIRWGSEFLYEGEGKGGESRAMFLIDDALKLGWTREQIGRRANIVKKHQNKGPADITSIRFNHKRNATWIESKWQFLPSLKEYRRFNLGPWPLNLEKLLHALVDSLLPFHANGIVHNKIRQDNIYVDAKSGNSYLAWYGVEPLPGVCLEGSNNLIIDLYGSAVDRWARRGIRERFAVSFIEAYAPEVLEGATPTPASDIFSVGAVLSLICDKELEGFSELIEKRRQWASGNLSKDLGKYITIVKKCLDSNPMSRFKNVIELKKALN